MSHYITPNELIGACIEGVRESLYAIDELREAIADYVRSPDCDPIELQAMALRLIALDQTYQMASAKLETWGHCMN